MYQTDPVDAAADRRRMTLGCSIVLQSKQTVHCSHRILQQQIVPISPPDPVHVVHLKTVFSFSQWR